MAIRWYGLVAPEEAATGDRRMFAGQALGYRDFPLPAAWQRVSGNGHSGSVVVASWDSQVAGDGGIWGYGTFLDPNIVPEVVEAMYLLQKKLIGPSVDLDPDLAYEVVPHPADPDEFAMKVTKATVHGVTFVMGPAFPQVHITVENDDEAALLASAGIEYTFAVNKSSWQNWPIAARETSWDFEDAINRVAQWSEGDSKKFAQAFLYQDKSMDPNNRESYRAPIADVHNGRLTLIPRGVMAAAAMLSGGHGGFEDIPQEERIQMQEVITQIYDLLRDQYGDPRFIAPWQRGGRAGATSSDDTPTATASLEGEDYQMIINLAVASEEFQSRLGGELEEYWVRGKGAARIRWGTPGDFDRCVRLLRDKFPQDTEGLCANLHHEALGKWPGQEHNMDSEVFAVRTSGWSSLPTSTGAWDEGAARRALDDWAGDDMAKYGRAFLWSDGSDNKTGFKFPIAMPVNGKLTIFIRAVNNAKARIGQADIPAGDKARIVSILNSIQERYSKAAVMDDDEMGDDYTVTASGVLYPPKGWFEDPKLGRPTPLHIGDDGRVYGHLATWKTCHLGVGNRCVMAPRSATGYSHFHLGSVKTQEGLVIPAGKITLGTGHADKSFGVQPATEHYDNTGAAVAVVRAGEDAYGIWVAGGLVAEVSEQRIAELRRSPLSGDWRRVNNNLELVAALAVNDPGFAVAHDDPKGMYSLVAAGVLGVEGAVGQAPADHPTLLAAVDEMLGGLDRQERRNEVERIFHDMLPAEEGCGCRV